MIFNPVLKVTHTLSGSNEKKLGQHQPKRIVAAVLSARHADLTCAQLSYIKDMANRVGFDVLAHKPEHGSNAYLIKLNVGMKDPHFIAHLEQDAKPGPSTAEA